MDFDFETAVEHQIALLSQGKRLEAFDKYFGDDGVMFDNDQPFGTGKAECRAKQESLILGATSITGNITSCQLDIEDSICVFRNQTRFVNASGEETEIDGIHWQRWSDGKIVEDRYYRGEAMAQKIADGILDEDLDAGVGDILDEPEPLPPHVAAEAAAMRPAILAALIELVGGEHVEIAPNATNLLADQLVVAGLEARNPRHALKKLRIALIDSDHVEEVYAPDSVLEAAFRSALGG